MSRPTLKRLVVVSAVIAVTVGYLWSQQSRKIPPYIVIVFPAAQHALWISGETRTESVKVTQGKPILSSNGQSGRRITVNGTGTLRYKGHEIVVREADVLVDGFLLLKNSRNWVLLPDGRLEQGFIRTFD
ncbi:MAG TPA: hypothetical protein VN577_12435 [Terriglobales bacterium]|nr:hypothetical protein [Terriglobales bacterium]